MTPKIRISNNPTCFIFTVTVSLLLLFLDIRLCLAFLVGFGLTASGSALQGLFQNPLADPYLLGVAGGSSLFGSVAMALGWNTHLLVVPLCSMLGAFVVCLIITQISRNESMILAGLLINAFASALISLIKTLLPIEQTQVLLFWLLGSISTPNLTTLLGVGGTILISTSVLVRKAHTIEILSLGDEESTRLGLNIQHEKRIIHLSISILVGVITAFCGFIGFIGLLVPQIARRFVGNDQKRLIPLSALCGGFLLLGFDYFSTLIHLPVGVITSLIGTPIFGVLAYVAHRKSMRVSSGPVQLEI